MSEDTYRDAEYISDDNGAPYTVGGYAVALNGGESGTPFNQRVAPVSPPRDYYNRADNRLADTVDADTAASERSVTESTLPFSTSSSVKRFAPNPRSEIIPEPRYTQRLSPVSMWLRNMLGGAPKRFSGNHFSMADHVREYEINGMVPQRSSRSTYRADAPSYGLSVVDIPAATEEVNGTIRALNVPRLGGSYRL